MMGWVSSYNYKHFLFLVILQDSGEKNNMITSYMNYCPCFKFCCTRSYAYVTFIWAHDGLSIILKLQTVSVLVIFKRFRGKMSWLNYSVVIAHVSSFISCTITTEYSEVSMYDTCTLTKLKKNNTVQMWQQFLLYRCVL